MKYVKCASTSYCVLHLVVDLLLYYEAFDLICTAVYTRNILKFYKNKSKTLRSAAASGPPGASGQLAGPPGAQRGKSATAASLES